MSRGPGASVSLPSSVGQLAALSGGDGEPDWRDTLGSSLKERSDVEAGASSVSHMGGGGGGGGVALKKVLSI